MTGAERGLEKVMADEDCREWIWELMSSWGLRDPIGATDPITIARQAGAQCVAMAVYDEIERRHPLSLATMVSEHLVRLERARVARGKGNEEEVGNG